MKGSYRDYLERSRLRRLALGERSQRLLGERRECILEIGCGHGHFLSAYASSHPDELCVGIDLITRRIERALRKKERLQLENLFFLKAEAMEFLEALPNTVSLRRTFLLFSDPWPKKRHHKKRVVQNHFLNRLAEKTVLGGELFFRTDDDAYFTWTREMLDAHPAWKIDPAVPWPFEETSFFQGILENYRSLIAVCGKRE